MVASSGLLNITISTPPFFPIFTPLAAAATAPDTVNTPDDKTVAAKADEAQEGVCNCGAEERTREMRELMQTWETTRGSLLTKEGIPHMEEDEEGGFVPHAETCPLWRPPRAEEAGDQTKAGDGRPSCPPVAL